MSETNIEKIDTPLLKSKMYNKFIKAPKDSDSQCTMNFSLKKDKGKLECVLMDNKKNELDLIDFKKDSSVECITQLKYIIFWLSYI
jgi:hypothetical protein